MSEVEFDLEDMTGSWIKLGRRVSSFLESFSKSKHAGLRCSKHRREQPLHKAAKGSYEVQD